MKSLARDHLIAYWRWLVLVLVAAIIAGAVVARGVLAELVSIGVKPSDSLAVLLALTCLILFIAEKRVSNDYAPPISPARISFVYYGLFFILPYVFDRLFIDTGIVAPAIGAYSEEWSYSFLCFLIGGFALGISSWVSKAWFDHQRKGRVQRQRRELSGKNLDRLGLAALLVNLVGILAQLYIFARIGGLTLLQSEVDNLRMMGAQMSPLITHLAFLPVTAFVLSVAFLSRYKGRSLGLVTLNVVNLLVALAILILASARFPAAVALLGGILVAGDAIRRLSKIQIVLASMVVVACMLAIGYWRFAVHGTVTSTIEGFLQSIVADTFGQARYFAIVPRIFPSEVPYYFGLTYLRIPFAFVPGAMADLLSLPKQAIWNTGGVFLKNYYGFTFAGGGIGVSALGEGYMNFGLVGVVLSASLYGVLMRAIEYLYLINTKDSLFRVLAHLLFAASFFYLTTELVLLFSPVVFMLLPFLLLAKSMSSGKRSSESLTSVPPTLSGGRR